MVLCGVGEVRRMEPDWGIGLLGVAARSALFSGWLGGEGAVRLRRLEQGRSPWVGVRLPLREGR